MVNKKLNVDLETKITNKDKIENILTNVENVSDKLGEDTKTNKWKKFECDTADYKEQKVYFWRDGRRQPVGTPQTRKLEG